MPDPATPTPSSPAPPTLVPGTTRSRRLAVGALVAVLVVAALATWFTTRALHRPRDVVTIEATPDPRQPIIDLARQATDAMFAFTAETAPGNIKAARSMLCGKALDDFAAIANGGRLTAELQDSGASADIGDDRYAVTKQDPGRAQVLAFFVRSITHDQSGTGRAPSSDYALRYTVDTTTLPMCINSIELLS
ncbi:hypothetical protein [Jongsikchunia kroppenstedtii]|uniref:hypothetical protein n=1 Tax=Jongsikchunia kroppenstedtii TaxID=1121721 RepID=UPI000374732F|nr:hypothetical protein [Jongsikchunia kroppenstedtii]